MAKQGYDHLFKILLIGDSGVGKTCLLCRFADDSFSSSFISTIGIDFKMKTIDMDGKKVKLQIWDTAGQERFYTITSTYYRGAMGIMLVYDITDSKTFDSMAKWLRNIEENANEDVAKMLIGNKCDAEERRAVDCKRGKEASKNHNMPFLETSAKTNINVKRAFQEIAMMILDKQIDKDADKKNEEKISKNINLNSQNRSYRFFKPNCC